MKLSLAAAALWAAFFASGALAQTWPAKPIRIIVPFAAGGNTDITARAIAERLAPVLKQQVIIDNRAGAMTNIGSEAVARAAPDGYTLLMGGATNAINMSFQAKLPYDTMRDFEHVILCVMGANVLSVHPSLPPRNLKELVALAKAQPGKLNYASSGLGSSNHMAAELLKMMTGINIAHIPYKGNAPALTDTVGGHVHMIFSGVPALLPHIESGRLRAIAIGSLKRFAAIPKVPTFDESGVKGYEATTWFGLMAPAKTPRDVVARVNTEVDKILKADDLRQRFLNDGLEPMGGSSEWYTKFIRSEIDKYAKVMKAAGITPQ